MRDVLTLEPGTEGSAGERGAGLQKGWGTALGCCRARVRGKAEEAMSEWGAGSLQTRLAL